MSGCCFRSLSVADDNVISLELDDSPHKYPANGIEVINHSPEKKVSLLFYEAWVEDSKIINFGGPLGYVPVALSKEIMPSVLSLTLMETIFSGDSAEYVGLQVSRLPVRGVSTTFKVIPSTQDLSYEVVLDRRVDSATNEISYPATYKYTFN